MCDAWCKHQKILPKLCRLTNQKYDVSVYVMHGTPDDLDVKGTVKKVNLCSLHHSKLMSAGRIQVAHGEDVVWVKPYIKTRIEQTSRM